MAGKCTGVNPPTTNNQAAPCGGNIFAADCVVITQALQFFGITAGDSVTLALSKIRNKVFEIDNKFSDTIKLSTLNKYTDDAAAGTAGLVTGKPYVDNNGFIKLKL